MFRDAIYFDQDLSEWDVSHVASMRWMFANTKKFNQDLSKWDVSHVTNMNSMFFSAESFNQDLSKWDVTRVTEMTEMFSQASSFNQDLSEWDVTRVAEMDEMFREAISFNQTLCGEAWVNSKATKRDMFSGGSPGSILRKPRGAKFIDFIFASTFVCMFSGVFYGCYRNTYCYTPIFAPLLLSPQALPHLLLADNVRSVHIPKEHPATSTPMVMNTASHHSHCN